MCTQKMPTLFYSRKYFFSFLERKGAFLGGRYVCEDVDRWKALLSRWCLLMDFGVLWNELICWKKEKWKRWRRSVFFVFVCVIFMIMSMMKKRSKKEMPYSACWSCVKVAGRKKRRRILSYFPLSLSFLSWSVLEFPFSSSNLYPFTHDTAIQ